MGELHFSYRTIPFTETKEFKRIDAFMTIFIAGLFLITFIIGVIIGLIIG